jgi:crossover junction endodeoxyribonuclease RuvC
MKILGIDPGLSFTGWAVITKECKHVKSGVIRLDKKKTVIGKITVIVEELKKIIDRHKVDIISIEKPIFNRLNPDSYFKQAETFGIIRYSFIEYDYNNKLFVYMPTEIKKILNIKGKNTKGKSKELVREEIKDIFGLENYKFKTYDESDAVAIAYCCIAKGDVDEF